MKHFFNCLITLIILFSLFNADIVFADELPTETTEIEITSEHNSNNDILDSYTKALTDHPWKVSADFGKGGSSLSDIIEFWPEIQLPSDNISLYKNAIGQIYIVFLYDNTYYPLGTAFVAEIIFAQDMKTFMLYSDNSAMIYSIVED